MSLHTKIARLLSPKPASPPSPTYLDIVNDAERRIVAKYAVGNIYLQLGRFRSFDRKTDGSRVDFRQYMMAEADACQCQNL